MQHMQSKQIKRGSAKHRKLFLNDALVTESSKTRLQALPVVQLAREAVSR